MQISVGTQLNMAGGKWYCFSIKRETRTWIAQLQDVALHSNMRCIDSNTVRYLSQQPCTFTEGDVITISFEVIFLRRLDTSGFMNLFSYYNLTKESKPDGLEGIESSSRETPDSDVEASGEGSETGSSTGRPSPSEANSPLHGDGRGGEDGVVIHARDSEGGQHSQI